MSRVQRCPNCGSESIHPSRTRTGWEKFRRRLTGRRPYRCHTCEWRGWGSDHGPKFQSDDVVLASNSLEPSPPNLATVSVQFADPAEEDRLPSLLDK